MKVVNLGFVIWVLIGCKIQVDEKSKTRTNDDSNIFIKDNSSRGIGATVLNTLSTVNPAGIIFAPALKGR